MSNRKNYSDGGLKAGLIRIPAPDSPTASRYQKAKLQAGQPASRGCAFTDED